MKRFLLAWDCKEAAAPAEKKLGKTTIKANAPVRMVEAAQWVGRGLAVCTSSPSHQEPRSLQVGGSCPVDPAKMPGRGEAAMDTRGDNRMRRWTVHSGVCPRLYPWPWAAGEGRALRCPCPSCPYSAQGQATEVGFARELLTLSVSSFSGET